MMDKETYLEIAGKIADGTASEREIALYNAYFNAYQLKYPLWNELTEAQRNAMIDEAELGIHMQLKQAIDRKPVRLWPKIAVAVAAVAAVVLCVYFFSSKYETLKPVQGDVAVNDVAPGKNGATITLANGKVIALSDAKSGVVVGSDLKYDDNTPVISNDGSSSRTNVRDLSYRRDDGVGENSMMLTAQTQKGQTYQFTLPDGTKVWLNADSKISFPSQFSGEERKILLEGEGYFEVAKLMDRSGKGRVPFKVESKGQTVEVLGTHFNINSYKDEIVTTTTLLEGSVRVAAFNSATGREIIMLKPNQQSILNANGTQVLNVDVNTVVGWKNGLFTYKNTPLSIVMRQIERWYNVSVAYDNNDNRLKAQLLSGSVSRYDNVSGILKAIELTGTVKFKVKDKTITVYQQ